MIGSPRANLSYQKTIQTFPHEGHGSYTKRSSFIVVITSSLPTLLAFNLLQLIT